MPGVFAKNFNDADQRIPMTRGMLEIVALGDAGVGRATFEPGWRWSVDEKPAVGSTDDYCAVPHVAYQATGTLHIVMSDGTEFDTNAGDVVVLPAGHDGWVVGDETVTLIDFGGLTRPIN